MSNLPSSGNVMIVAPPRWFWEWQDDGQTIAWHDGPTLAFQTEILEIIARLGPAQTPPLGAILLVLAALRENWSAAPPRCESLRAIMRLQGGPSELELLEQVLPLLDRVHALPAPVRADASVKTELAAQIFAGLADQSRTKFEAAQLETAVQQRRLNDVLRIPSANVVIKKSLRRDLACLNIALASFDEARFRSLLNTGLETVPQPAKIPTPAPLTGRQLLAKLRDDEALGAVARLTQRLLSLTHLPRPLDDPHDLPLGGVTDIAPRGSLDRLLLSELAYDNDVLAVRVAMNEALYLRREAPPRNQIRQRRVLIDIGIRMWGVPRVYAMAVGMALAIKNESVEQVRLNYWQRQQLHELSATTPEDWRTLLAALDPRPEPGPAIPALIESMGDDADLLEPVIVTCVETMTDPAFQVELAKLSNSGCYLAIVNRNGGYQLWQHSPAGTQLLNRAILDLDQLLAEPKPTIPLVDPQRQHELPAFVLLPRVPLRLTHEIKLDQTWEIANRKLLTLTGDGRLLLWDDPKVGALQVASGLPQGRILAAAQEHQGQEIELIVGSLSSDGLHAVRLTSTAELDQVVPLKLNLPTPREALIHHGLAWVFSDQEVVAASILTGEVLDRKKYPGGFNPAHRKGRYLPLGQPPCKLWRVISFDGQQIIFTDIGPVKSDPQRDVVDKVEIVFDTQSDHAPMALLSNGTLYGLESKKLISNDYAPLADRPWYLLVSRNGRRFSMNAKYLFDLGTLVWTKVAGMSLERILEPRLSEQSHVTMWTRFTDLVWDSETRRLGLTNRRDKVSWFDERLGIKMHNLPKTATYPKQEWTRLRHPQLQSLCLYKTEFADGSSVFKDSRGLLHFRSSDPQLPEFTIVVAGGHHAGWASNGWMWGDDYFVKPNETRAWAQVQATLFEPFFARLR